MYFTRNILALLLSFICLFFLFYGFMLFLPFIIIVVGGYVIYILLKSWLLQRKIRKFGCLFDKMEDEENSGNVIDAEFEILDEKARK